VSRTWVLNYTWVDVRWTRPPGRPRATRLAPSASGESDMVAAVAGVPISALCKLTDV